LAGKELEGGNSPVGMPLAWLGVVIFFSRPLAPVATGGVWFESCSAITLPACEYTPMQVKQSLTGYGKAQKPEVQRQVAHTLGLDCVPKPDDAADALAIALTHAIVAAGGATRPVR